MTAEKPKFIDLFAGAGGMALGFQMAGFEPEELIDWDPAAIETLHMNFEAPAFRMDLSKDPLKKSEVGDIDLVIGGPPCQGWSRHAVAKNRSLGKESGANDPRSALTLKFFEAVRELTPKVFVMENVQGVLEPAPDKKFSEMTSFMSKAAPGYTVIRLQLQAVCFGIPQYRERIFFIGIHGSGSCFYDAGFHRPQIPELNRFFLLQECQLAPDRKKTVWDAIGDMPNLYPGQTLESDHAHRPVSPADRKIFSFIKEGGDYRDVPEKYRRSRADIFQDKYRRLSWGKASHCITAHLSKVGQHPHSPPTRSDNLCPGGCPAAELSRHFSIWGARICPKISHDRKCRPPAFGKSCGRAA